MKEEQHIVNDNIKYWDNYYESSAPPSAPSSFLLSCIDRRIITKSDSVVEFGCGNGRDGFAIIDLGARYLGIDASSYIIQKNNEILTALHLDGGSSEFISSKLDNFHEFSGKNSLSLFSVFYSRFFLHAIPLSVQTSLLNYISATASVGALMLHEFRTDRDRLAKVGRVLSGCERLTDHYRRFSPSVDLKDSLVSLGWEIIELIESDNLASHLEDNPVVCRVIARKYI